MKLVRYIDPKTRRSMVVKHTDSAEEVVHLGRFEYKYDGPYSEECLSSVPLDRSEIHVRLLHERVDVWRPTQADDLGKGLFKILPLPDGVPADEKWEFPPGSIVRGEQKTVYQGVDLISVLVAVKP